jgi:nucleoid-associated protein YgaU
MFNPLRLPIVLIAIFGVMLFYVHAYHRRRSEVRNTTTAPVRDHLRLRHSTEAVGSSTSFQSESPVKGPASAVIDQRAGAVGVGTRTGRRPLPQVDANTKPSGEDPVPSATLIPPTASPSTPAPSIRGWSTDTLPTSGDRLLQRTYSPDVSPVPGVMHRIVDGDTLPGLAERYLGDAARYPEILEANKDVLLRPDLLPLGVRLRIPSREPSQPASRQHPLTSPPVSG